MIALVVIIATKGRLGYQPASKETINPGNNPGAPDALSQADELGNVTDNPGIN